MFGGLWNIPEGGGGGGVGVLLWTTGSCCWKRLLLPSVCLQVERTEKLRVGDPRTQQQQQVEEEDDDESVQAAPYL